METWQSIRSSLLNEWTKQCDISILYDLSTIIFSIEKWKSRFFLMLWVSSDLNTFQIRNRAWLD